MALVKRMTLPNGVPLEYHRISSITHMVGEFSNVEVIGYTSQAKRMELVENPLADVYQARSYHEMPYTDGLTVAQAYDWLKGTEDYAGAEDADGE